jgi:hypothetical protein
MVASIDGITWTLPAVTRHTARKALETGSSGCRKYLAFFIVDSTLRRCTLTNHSIGGHVRFDLASRKGGILTGVCHKQGFQINIFLKFIFYYNVSKVP